MKLFLLVFLSFFAYAFFFCTNLCITCFQTQKTIKPTEKSTNGKEKFSCISYVPLLLIAFVVTISSISVSSQDIIFFFVHFKPFFLFWIQFLTSFSSQLFQVLLQSRFPDSRAVHSCTAGGAKGMLCQCWLREKKHVL